MSEVEQPTVEQPTVVEEPQEEVLSEVQAAARNKQVIQMGGGAVACVGCEKRSYPAETIYFEQIPYHVNCFKCVKCNQKMEGTFNAAVFDHKLYCRRCFQHDGLNRLQAQVKWTPKTSSGSSTTSSTFSKFGGGSVPCNSCQKACYPAETVQFEGKPYHSGCIACSECKTGCTVNNISQFDDKLYCSKCWNKNGFARKQLESAQKWEKKDDSHYSDIALKLGGGSTPCSSCQKACYPAETVQFEGKPYHSGCIACSECKTGCTVNNIGQFEDKLYCNKCWTKNGFARKQLESAQKWTPRESSTPSGAFAKFGGGGTKCDVCEKTVYPAETISYEGRYYHPKCFNCTHCQQRIPTVNNAEHKGPVPYCKRCFQQLELWRADK